MNDRQVRYFIAVANELSFSKAAQRLNVSQPPLSMQIKALEDELGAPLLNRTKRSVELTQTGAMFLERATKAIQHLDEAADIVRRAARGEAGILRVGFTSSVPMLDAFTELLREFRETYPHVQVELKHISSRKQFKALAEQTLDVGILRPPYRYEGDKNLDTYEFWRDRLVVFIPEGHPLALGSGEISVEELGSACFVAVSAQEGCGVRDHVVTLCGRAGFQPNIVQEGNELSTVLGLVSAGIGIAILPECYKRVTLSGVVNRPLKAIQGQSRLLLAFRPQKDSKVAQNFLRIAQHHKERRDKNTAAPPMLAAV